MQFTTLHLIGNIIRQNVRKGYSQKNKRMERNHEESNYGSKFLESNWNFEFHSLKYLFDQVQNLT